MDLDTLWQTALGELEISLSKANYTTWLKGSFLASVENNKVVVGVGNNFSKEWLRKKFSPQILETLSKLTSSSLDTIEYIVAVKSGVVLNAESSPLIPSPVDKSNTPVKAPLHTRQVPKLNPDYTFEHFVVGSSNRLAHAAASAIAENPGRVYNPFFVYGGVGLGKTHLIQAIAQKVLEHDPSKRVVYITCEQFTNEFVDALRSGKASEFKHFYREADLLLIDDIQFVAGKEATQEELFHTFNTLYQQNRQIIITSDRVPKAIPTLEARLSSRFEGGLIVDINLPDVETRIAIIQAKCEERHFELDDKLITFIAHGLSTNIREIEGALNRLIAYCELEHHLATESVIQKILAEFLTSSPQKSVSPSKIIKAVASYYSISTDEIIGQKRTKEIVYPRHIAMHLLHTELNLSFPIIGREFGGKDHTTIIHACEKIENELKKNESLQSDITTIKSRLYNLPPAN